MLDTKLKNRHKLGILLIFCVIVSAAFLMVSAFPMVVKEADSMAENYQSDYSDESVGNVCGQMIHWPYVLWMQEQEEEAQKVLTPSQVLAPGLLEKTSSYAMTETQPLESVSESMENTANADGSGGTDGAENPGDAASAGGAGNSDSAASTDAPANLDSTASAENTENADSTAGAENTENAEGTVNTEGTENTDGTVSAEGTEDSGSPQMQEDKEYIIQIKLEQEEENRTAQQEQMRMFQDLRHSIDSTGRMWQTNLREWQGSMNYKMLDENGQILSENAAAITGEWVQVRMYYGEQGMLDGVYLETSEEEWKEVNKAETVKGFEQYLTEFYYTDVLRDCFCGEDVYEDVQFSGPKNRMFEFTIPVERIFTDINSRHYRNWHYTDNGVYLLVLMALALYVTLAAILLPCIPSLRLGRGKISRLPFECVALELGFTAVAGYVYGAAFFLYLANGELPGWIAEVTAWPEKYAYQAAMAMCLVYWIVVFALGYWGVHCLRAVLCMGMKQYLKERTITGKFCCWCFDKWLRVYRTFREVDLEKQSTKTILKIVLANFVVLAVISCFWMFGILFLAVYSVILFFLLTKYWAKVYKKYEILLRAVKQMADGKLDAEIPDDLGVFESLKEELQKVQRGFKMAVEEETRSQRMKTELITNVSHDLKTPLTAIVTYVNLLKQENITEEERNSYIDILDRKSMRLKTLIEDLFEVSKAASRTVKLNLVEVDIVSLLKQVRLELSDRLEQSGVMFRWDFPEEKVLVMLDSDKTYRIFENLLVNIAKYAMPGTRAYIEVGEEILPEEKEEDSLKGSLKENEYLKKGKDGKKEHTERRKAAEKTKHTRCEALEGITEEIKAKIKESTKETAEKNIEDAEETIKEEMQEVTAEAITEAATEEMRKEEEITTEPTQTAEGVDMERDEADMQTAKNFKAFLNPVKQKKKVWISMKNISTTEIHVNPEELTERFVRGDESRNTEGSGLGLAIAKNFVEAQNGTMDVEVEADLFKVRIEWEC